MLDSITSFCRPEPLAGHRCWVVTAALLLDSVFEERHAHLRTLQC